MTEAADQRFAPPQAHVADVAVGEMELAGRGTRFLAALVDGIIGACVGWGVLMIPGLKEMAAAQTVATVQSMWSFTPVSLFIGFAVFLVLQGWLLVTRGQTIGKILFKLRIVRPDGSKPDAMRLLGLRYGVGLLMNVTAAISMIWALVDSLLIFRASRKCLHDTIADTQVIKL